MRLMGRLEGCLEGCLKGCLGGSWGRRLEATTGFKGHLGADLGVLRQT